MPPAAAAVVTGWASRKAVRELHPELRAAIGLLREGEHGKVSTVRMLEIADRARTVGDYFNAGAAFEIADASVIDFIKTRRGRNPTRMRPRDRHNGC